MEQLESSSTGLLKTCTKKFAIYIGEVCTISQSLSEISSELSEYDINGGILICYNDWASIMQEMNLLSQVLLIT